MISSRCPLVLSSVLVLQLLACGGSDRSSEVPGNTATASTGQAPTTSPPGAIAETATTPAPSATEEPRMSSPTNAQPENATPADMPMAPNDAAAALSDDQILEITHTANLGEIEQAKLAQTKARDPRVKKLAAMMLKDHTAADAKGTSLATKANLTPTSSATSTSIASDVALATSALKSEGGADFDKAYVDAQVKEHQSVLDTIDQKLIPNVRNAQLKAFLAEVRPAIAAHLQHAQELQAALQK